MHLGAQPKGDHQPAIAPGALDRFIRGCLDDLRVHDGRLAGVPRESQPNRYFKCRGTENQHRSRDQLTDEYILDEASGCDFVPQLRLGLVSSKAGRNR